MNAQNDISALIISVLTGVFLVLSFVFFLLIVFKKIKQLKEEYIRKKHWVKVQEHLAQVLIQSVLEEESWDYQKSVRLLKKSIKKSALLKQWLLDEMIIQRANLSGEAQTTLMRIYSELDYKHYSLKKLKSLKWLIVMQGIHELEQMKQHDCFTHFYKFISSKNQDLRRVARMGLTSLAPNPLGFLEHQKEELTEWEQMNISSRLKMKKREQLPDFRKYYNHPESSVSSFCIQMSVQFGCYDHIPSIIDLLSKSSQKLQVVVINGLTELGAFQAYKEVISVAFLKKEIEENIIIAALKFLSEMGSEEDWTIINQMINHPSFEVRLQAVNTALKLNFDQSGLNDEISNMIQHHQHELI